MSARDVDDEFEKAYQRLFSRSTTTGAPSNVSSSSASEPVAESSKAPHRPASSSPAALAAGLSSHRVIERQQTPRGDRGIQALLRHHPAVKAHSASRNNVSARHQNVEREQPPYPSSSRAGLDALAHYSRADTSKGKARANLSRADTPDRHSASNTRNSTTSDATVPQQQQASTPIPQAEAVAYYPYAQASYSPSGTMVAPSLATMPGQAVAWAQPVMSAGPVPAMAYPGFSAQVTFAQPQFFAAHPPQQLQPALTTFPQQYTHQQSVPVTPLVHTPSPQQLEEQHPSTSRETSQRRQEPGSPAAKPSTGTRRILKTTNSILEAKIRKILQASGIEFRSKDDTSPRRSKIASSSSITMDASLSPSARARQHAHSVMGDFREKRRVKLGDKPKQKQTRAKPLLDDQGNVIRRKRGRPRIRPLTPEVDVKPKITNGTIDGMPLVKTEAQGGVMPPEAAAMTYPPSFDGALPLPEHAGKPFRKETYTMFVQQSRRLRWLARQATLKAETGSEARNDSADSPPDTTQWSRWSNSIWAQLQSLTDEPPSSTAATISFGHSSPTTSQSQSDPAGLFPRERRREYVALRKQLHSASRTAAARICIRRLMRYLAKVAAAADQIDSRADKSRYIERKHRAAKLTKHMFRFTRPTALDLRKLWVVWAHAAHQANTKKDTTTPSQQRRVTFASHAEVQPVSTPPLQPQRASEEEGPRVKLEPPSPNKSSLRFAQSAQPAEETRIKAEPSSDDIMTPPLPPHSVAIKFEAQTSMEPTTQSQRSARTNSPLFLRRNFRIYRLVGLSHLPLS